LLQRPKDCVLDRLVVHALLSTLNLDSFAHFIDEDVEHFQAEVDKMWTEWLIPGVIPFTVSAKDQSILKIDKKPLHERAPAAGQQSA